MKKNIHKKMQFKVWQRDFWSCRYCGEVVFFSPTLKLLDKLSPGHGYYHPNGKTNKILGLFQWKWASIDHINPVTKGGLNDEDNYVTSCWQCNLKFGNKNLNQGKSKPIEININSKLVNWDGLSSLYIKLVNKDDEWARIIKNSK